MRARRCAQIHRRAQLDCCSRHASWTTSLLRSPDPSGAPSVATTGRQTELGPSIPRYHEPGMNRFSGRASLRASLGRAGRSIVIAIRWAGVGWTAFCLFTLACLLDTMGLSAAIVEVGLYWLVGMQRHRSGGVDRSSRSMGWTGYVRRSPG